MGRPHSILDLLAKVRDWGADCDEVKESQIVIMTDSPSSAEKILNLNFNVSAEKIYRVNSLARLKRDYPEKFWNLPGVHKAFQELPIERGIDLKREVWVNLTEAQRIALAGNAQIEGEKNGI